MPMVVRISQVNKFNESEYFISNERHYQFKYKSTSSKYNIFVWKKYGVLYIWEEDWYAIYDPHYSFGKQSKEFKQAWHTSCCKIPTFMTYTYVDFVLCNIKYRFLRWWQMSPMVCSE